MNTKVIGVSVGLDFHTIATAPNALALAIYAHNVFHKFIKDDSGLFTILTKLTF